MVSVRTTPTFRRSVKRLHRRQKTDLDNAVRAIAEEPMAGAAKRGDLTGVRVFKFRMNNQHTLLAYQEIEGEGVIKLLALGSHENFYRDLKR